ncbi:MAG: 50S ribosomal protein L21e [Candidatus Woesearchaeota archaeon]|jgi:large subunit ribosomal protein L21e|nr:50S ribosomal protein L21e [Candidatus Woesearchaeota archaeon]|tara:strand:+ start:219 stop:506 length:288 start_codon:yes stop_codon:yes gene_type:complete
MKRIGKFRRKTRYKLKKDIRNKGKISITKYLQNFKTGEMATLLAEPAVQKGLYHPRFYGKRGIVKSKVGRCFEVTIKDGNKEKTLIVHPIHLRKV